MLAVTRSLVTEGSFAVPESALGKHGLDGRKYAWYGPGCSVAAAPLFWVGRGAAYIVGLGPEKVSLVEELFVAGFNPLIVALTSALLYLVALQVGLGRPWAAAGGLIYAFATGLFVQMKDFNSEPLTALLFLLVGYCLLRLRHQMRHSWALVAGAAAGFAILTRPANGLGVLLLGLAACYVIWQHARGWQALAHFISFALPALAGVALYGLYNYVRFGDALDTGYHTISFDYPLLRGLHLQLLSLERGLLWYNPVTVLAFAGAGILWYRRRKLLLLCGALVAAYVLLYSTYAQAPAGGHSAGQRFLLVVMPFLVLLALPAIEAACTRWQRGLVAAIIGASVLVQLPLVHVNPSYYYARMIAKQELRGESPGAKTSADTLLVASWPLAAEVTRDALLRPEYIFSLAERGHQNTTAAEMLPGPRAFHVPYFWWVLAYFYGVPRWAIGLGLLLIIGLVVLSVSRLFKYWPRNGQVVMA